MTTSSSTPEKVSNKNSQILPSNFHLKEKSYVGCVTIGNKNYYTPYYDNIEEARLELRCLEKQLGYELVQTIQDEGFYPKRAIMIEEMYQASGRTNGLYTGLYSENGQVSEHGSL